MTLPPAPAARTQSVLATRNLMTTAAIGVIGCLLVVPLTFIFPVVAVSPKGILIACSLMGLWIIPYLLPGIIVKKPGAILIASLIMGIITAFTTPMGPISIIGNLIGGVLVGTPIALFLYRKWTWWTYALSGILFGGFNGYLYASHISIAQSSTDQWLGTGLAIASSWLGVGICLAIEIGLRKTGLGIKR